MSGPKQSMQLFHARLNTAKRSIAQSLTTVATSHFWFSRKTTLSADPHRALIGDDEHGWDEDGIFNFEGGCYAKTINLTEKTEPDIYRAIRTDAMLENVALVEGDNNKLIPDYFNTSKTENGRVSYPIFHIPNYVSARI